MKKEVANGNGASIERRVGYCQKYFVTQNAKYVEQPRRLHLELFEKAEESKIVLVPAPTMRIWISSTCNTTTAIEVKASTD
jgi:hypothetical protein